VVAVVVLDKLAAMQYLIHFSQPRVAQVATAIMDLAVTVDFSHNLHQWADIQQDGLVVVVAQVVIQEILYDQLPLVKAELVGVVMELQQPLAELHKVVAPIPVEVEVVRLDQVTYPIQPWARLLLQEVVAQE
jgi:hypothetical protein